jgi:hypothetical protein
MLTCSVCMRRGIRSQASCGPIDELSRRHLHHRGSLRHRLAFILRQLPESLVLVISRLRLRRVRFRQILIKKGVKSGCQPASITTSRIGIRRNKPWKPFPFPISLGRIIPASSPYPGCQYFYGRADPSLLLRHAL